MGFNSGFKGLKETLYCVTVKHSLQRCCFSSSKGDKNWSLGDSSPVVFDVYKEGVKIRKSKHNWYYEYLIYLRW